jgi:hypothetical protein
MLPVSLDCPFLIAPSVFSNIYLITHVFSIWCLYLERIVVATYPNFEFRILTFSEDGGNSSGISSK